MIRDLLCATSLRPAQRDRLAGALSAPWIWPADPELVDRARALGFAAPRRLAGEVLLVSPGSLWRFGAREDRAADALGPDAQAVFERARHLATLGLPFAFGVESAFATGPWGAQHLAGELSAEGDGAAFGASMSLAFASLLMHVPVPEHLAAIAALDPDGSLRPVPALGERIAMLRGSALGVSRIVVAVEQEPEACVEVAKQCGGLEVIGTRTLEGLHRAAFPGLHISPPSWLCRERVGDAARELFACALAEDPRVVDWGCIQRGAAHVISRAQHEPERQMAEFAREVALRRRRSDGALGGRLRDGGAGGRPRRAAR